MRMIFSLVLFLSILISTGSGCSGSAPDGTSSNELTLVNLTPDEMPVSLSSTALKKSISFTAVVKLAIRPDASAQVITLATLSANGRVLGQLKQIASNVFQIEVADRSTIIDSGLTTAVGDPVNVKLTLTFTDDRGEVKTFDQMLGAECSQYHDHTYFCNGACRGLYPSYVSPPVSSCGGCGLACSYTNSAGSKQDGTCSTYNRNVSGGWAETCGTFIKASAMMGTVPAEQSKSCNQYCAQYSGRGKTGKCVDRCYATSDGQIGGFGDASGQSFGGVEGILGGYRSGQNYRGIAIGCAVIPADYVASLPSSTRPDSVLTVGCCCSFD